MGPNPNWFKSYDTKHKYFRFQFFAFFFHFFSFVCLCTSATTLEPPKILTCSAHLNDHLNLSFVKDIYVVGKKLARNHSAICPVANFGDQSLPDFFVVTKFPELPIWSKI